MLEIILAIASTGASVIVEQAPAAPEAIISYLDHNKEYPCFPRVETYKDYKYKVCTTSTGFALLVEHQ